MIDRGRFFPLEAAHRGGVGRVDTVDDVGQVFPVAAGVVDGERCCFYSHGSAFLVALRASGR